MPQASGPPRDLGVSFHRTHRGCTRLCTDPVSFGVCVCASALVQFQNVASGAGMALFGRHAVPLVVVVSWVIRRRGACTSTCLIKQYNYLAGFAHVGFDVCFIL